jgi:hypothetical protein
MATTYAAYYNLAQSGPEADSRRQSSYSNASSTPSRKEKIMSLLTPRMPVHEPLTPTKAQHVDRAATATEDEPAQSTPTRIYHSVLRRPLFQKARPGNEVSTAEQRRRGSSIFAPPRGGR